MGRTISKFRDDDEDRRKKSTKSLKHSKNIPGQGMRVINSWSEEISEDDYEDMMYHVDDYDDDSNDEYNDNTSQTLRK